MKFVSYREQGRNSYGVLRLDSIVDLGGPLSATYPDLKALLGAGKDGLAAAAKVLGAASAGRPMDGAELLPVIPNPGTVWCAGMNTHTHFHEAKAHLGMKDLPPKPILFIRATSTLVGSGHALEKPRLENAFDFEGEIALVIGRRGRNIAVADALDYIAGYSCFNDASARDYQRTSTQMTAGKNAYRSGGFGPCLATPDEVDLKTMYLVCRVNGREMQRMTLDDLIFGFAELISFISEFNWLEPGDVIVTGAAEGVGLLRKPPVLLQSGDKVEVEVSGVGTLINAVAEQSA